MQQVAVTRLDVHELKAHLLRQAGGRDIVVDQSLQVVVRPDHRVVVPSDAELGVQQRMVIGNPRPERSRVGPAETPRVSQLQAHNQIVRAGEPLAVRGEQFLAQRRQSSAIRGNRQGLMWVRSPVRLHRRRFAAPDQFGAAQAEVPPAAKRQFGRRAVAAGRPNLPWGGCTTGCRPCTARSAAVGPAASPPRPTGTGHPPAARAPTPPDGGGNH